MLILLPNTLGGPDLAPPGVAEAVASLDGLIAESERGGRRFLGRYKTKVPAASIPIATLDEDVNFLLEPLQAGKTWGVVSDAGLPCLADPGSKLVARARKLGLKVKAFSGPCSITLALMLSGLPAQTFCFHGYLKREREKHLKSLDKGRTHLFIEAPYRNEETLKACIEHLPNDALLGTATDLTLESEEVHCLPVHRWKELPNLKKRPTVFLAYLA